VRWLVVVLCVVVASTHHAMADAQARHALHWTRAPGAERCIDAATLTAAVEARIGRSVFTTDRDPAVTIEGHVRPGDRGWHVTVTVRGADTAGERELDEPAPDCRALDDALVLVIALIVDPDAVMREPAPPQPPSPPPPAAVPVTPPPPAPPAPISRPWHIEAVAGVIGAGFVLPGGSIGGSLGVSIDAPTLPPVLVRGTLWREDEHDEAAQGARFRLITAGLAMCPQAWQLALCGGVELGRMTGRGVGFDRNQESAAFVAYLAVEPQVSVSVSPRLALTASLGSWIPLVRPQFVFDQGGEPMALYQPAPASIVGRIGMAVRF